MLWYNLMNQQLRTTGDWVTHQLAVKNLVKEALPRLSQRKVVMVLGAGNCRDIPLDLLSREFQTIVLVDIDGDALIHARQKAPTAITLTCDITGLHDWIADCYFKAPDLHH